MRAAIVQTAEYVKPGEYIELGGLYRVYAEVAGDRVKLTTEAVVRREASRPSSGPLARKVKEQSRNE